MLVGAVGLAFTLPAGLVILTNALGAAGLVAMAATRPVPALRFPALRSCGKYSYAMYVLHPAWIMEPLYKKHPHSISLMLGGLILGPIASYALALISWNLLEKRMLALKRYFPYKPSPQPDGIADGEPSLIIAS